MVAQRWQAQLLPSRLCSLVCYWPLAVSLAKGGDTKIELGFSMSLRRAVPGIRPEGRRLGTLRLAWGFRETKHTGVFCGGPVICHR